MKVVNSDAMMALWTASVMAVLMVAESADSMAVVKVVMKDDAADNMMVGT